MGIFVFLVHSGLMPLCLGDRWDFHKDVALRFVSARVSMQNVLASAACSQVLKGGDKSDARAFGNIAHGLF